MNGQGNDPIARLEALAVKYGPRFNPDAGWSTLGTSR